MAVVSVEFRLIGHDKSWKQNQQESTLSLERIAGTNPKTSDASLCFSPLSFYKPFELPVLMH